MPIRIGDRTIQHVAFDSTDDSNLAAAPFCDQLRISRDDCGLIADRIRLFQQQWFIGLSGAPSSLRQLPNGRLVTPYDTPSAFEQLLEERSSKFGDVVIVTSNDAYEDFLINWICHAEALSIDNFIVLTPSEGMARRLADNGYGVYLFQAPVAQSAQLQYGTVRYQQLILARTLLVQQGLRLGKNILIADIDAVWLADPFLELHQHFHDVMAPTDGYNDQWICGCFVYLRNTKRTIAAWAKVAEQHSSTVERGVKTGQLLHKVGIQFTLLVLMPCWCRC
jgi:hypothetical protein